ncbi:MAG: serine/threonine-protein kinase, partial [Pseudomonadota bacterium]
MPQPGQILGNYRVVRLLGTGAFAEVYEAEDPLLQRPVALKVLAPEVGRTPDMLARFQREVRAVAALNHPGIVAIYAVGETDGLNFYAMRLLPGGDLRKQIGRGIPPQRALEILASLASALDHAHQQGIVHRDIKPENILFDEDGHAVLTDFGIAKVLRAQEQLTAIGTAMGTPQYLSPEQARGGAVDARTDLYSLGVVLFEMLTGRAPYSAADPLSVVLMHATEPVPKLPPEHADLQPLVDQLMAKHPGQRPAAAAELERLVRRLLRRYPGAAAGPPLSAAAAAAASTPAQTPAGAGNRPAAPAADPFAV